MIKVSDKIRKLDCSLSVQNLNDDEIDIGELFSALLSGWKILVFFTSVFFISAVYYALNVPIEKFESVATIQFSDANNNTQFSNLGGIASLAGISLPSNRSDQVSLDTRLNSRTFILGLDKKVELFSDDYFNPHLNQNTESSSNLSLGSLKSLVLNLLSDTDKLTEEQDQRAELSSKVEHVVLNIFRSNLRIEELDGGAVRVFFKHSSPIRAAEILNSAIEAVITQISLEKEEAARVRLNYLEGELTRIQKELEVAVDAMQKYAVEYNLASIQDLASSSFRTDNLRDELNVLRDSLRAIVHLHSSSDFTKEYLTNLRLKFPFIGTLDFRSRLNLPADINAWTKPTENEFEAAQLRVSVQIEDLTALISDLEKKARSTANEAKMYSELQRNVKVQETLYEVVIKQFESQSLSSGLPGKTVDFYESGVPPIYKVEPKRSLIVTLGVVLGLFTGSIFVLVKAAKSGVIYSRRLIFSKSKEIGTLIRLSNVNTNFGRRFSKSFKFVQSNIQKYRNLTSFSFPSQLVCGVFSTYHEGNARCLALVLMQGMRRYFDGVQLLDVDGLFKLDNVNEQDRTSLGKVSSLLVEKDCEVLQPHSELTSYELNLYVEQMRLDGIAVILLFGDLEVRQNEVMLLSGLMDKMFFGVKIKKTTRNHLVMINEVLSKCEKPGAIVCC